MNLSLELISGSRAVFETLAYSFIVVEDVDDFAHKGSAVHFPWLSQGSLQKAFEILVFDHGESEVVEVGAHFILGHLFLDELGNNGVFFNSEAALLQELEQFEFGNRFIKFPVELIGEFVLL